MWHHEKHRMTLGEGHYATKNVKNKRKDERKIMIFLMS